MNKRLATIATTAGIGILAFGGIQSAQAAAPPCPHCEIGELAEGIVGSSGIRPVDQLVRNVASTLDSTNEQVWEEAWRTQKDPTPEFWQPGLPGPGSDGGQQRPTLPGPR